MFVSVRSVRAQTVPDAGSVLQQIEKQRHDQLPQKTPPSSEAPPATQSPGGATIQVKAFRFVGNTRLSDKQLAAFVSGFTGHPIDFAALQNAAVAVANAYRKAGWVVRAFLPQQDVTSGTITIRVVEAKFGAVNIRGATRRGSPATLKSLVESAQSPGAPVNAEALDRALLLISDLPGLTASGRLSEGREQAETDLDLTVSDGPLAAGRLDVDNTGSRFTGIGRVLATGSLNSPFGLGDRIDGVLLGTQGSGYVRGDYSVPVGVHGLRVGVNGSYLRYKVLTSEFSALDARGNSTTVGIESNYPLLRSRLENLYIALNIDDKRFDNRSGGQTTTHYTIDVATLGLYGNLFDSIGAGGSNTASLALEQGHVDLSGSPNEAADAATTHTAGGFLKLRLTGSRLQALNNWLSLYADLSGQVTNKNLDSSEKLYLGGFDGVRAYPANEGGGSAGAMLNFEVRTRLPARFGVTGFFDWGTVRVNEHNDIVGAAVPNADTLKGAGLAVDWVAGFGLSLKATFARRIGRNPAPASNGDDQDGSLIENRCWLQASMPF